MIITFYYLNSPSIALEIIRDFPFNFIKGAPVCFDTFLKHSCTIQTLQYQDFISISTIFRQVQHAASQKKRQRNKQPIYSILRL